MTTSAPVSRRKSRIADYHSGVVISVSPLDGFRVLDLTQHLCGPYCTKLLADFGADVIKIERPGSGDPARLLGPFKGDDPHLERSGTFAYLNTNKRSITLDLRESGGRDTFLRLLDTADLVVVNFRPGVMDAF